MWTRYDGHIKSRSNYLQSATRVCTLGINGLSGLARRLTNYFDISSFFPHTQRPVVFRIVGSTAAVG